MAQEEAPKKGGYASGCLTVMVGYGLSLLALVGYRWLLLVI